MTNHFEEQSISFFFQCRFWATVYTHARAAALELLSFELEDDNYIEPNNERRKLISGVNIAIRKGNMSYDENGNLLRRNRNLNYNAKVWAV